MATSQLLNKKIKALEATLKKKSNFKPSVVAKLELQLKSFQAELSKLTSKKSNAKKPSVLQKLKKMVKTKTNLKVYNQAVDKSGRKTDLVRDAERPALPTGRRVSKGTGANQYGKAVKGRVYYENRPNRIDVKQPPKRYPKLEEGGMMAKGGQVSGYFTFRPYKLEGNFYFSTTLKDVSPDNVMRKGLEGKLKGNDYNSAEYVAMAILDEFDYIDKVEIVKKGATLLKSKVVASFERDSDDKKTYNVQYMADGGMMAHIEYPISDERKPMIKEGYILLVKDTEQEAKDYISKYPDLYYEKYNDKWAIKKSFEEGVMMAKGGFVVFNYTDNIHASNEVFKTKKEAKEFIENFRNRFNQQGYYRTSYGERIPTNQIDLEIIPEDFNPFKKMADGGMMADVGMTNTFDNILLENGFKKIKTFAGVRFFQKGDIFASVDDKLREVRVETNDNTIYSGYSITDLLYILKQNKNLFSEKTMMANGGQMEQGGKMAKGGSVLERLKKAKEMGIKGYGKAKEYTQKQIHDKKKSIALDVIVDTLNDDYFDTKKGRKDIRAVRITEELVEEKYAKGGYVPENIKNFAKRKGVSSLVNKVAGWAEKVGKGIKGGTAIGKNYDTLILDMGYQTSDIYIDTLNETIELYGKEVYNFSEFKKVYDEHIKKNVEEKYAKGGMTDIRMKYAKEDVETLAKEGNMSMYDTKYGVIHLSYNNGIFTIKNNQYNPSVKDYKTIFEGNKEDAVKFIADSYVVEGMAKGGMTEISDFKTNLMGTASFMLQLPNMRKPQEFIVYPIQESDNPIITIQSDTRIGKIDLSSGRGLMSESHASGAYFVHLQMDKKTPFQLNDVQLNQLKEKIRSTGGKEVGSRGIISDNSGALNIMEMGGKVQFKSHRLNK